MGKRITLADVAKEAGVSAKTVSNVINRTGRMSSETRQIVENAISKLGYRINKSAQSLRAGTTKIIGIAVPGFSNPFFGLLCDTVAKYARTHGYGLTISTYSDLAGGLDGLIDETYEINADGWIFLTDRPIPHNSDILKQRYPVVLIGDFPAYGKVDTVSMPDADGAEYATRWLLDHGCRRVAFIGAPPAIFNELNSTTVDELLSQHEGNMSLRLRGYIRALRAYGIPIDWNLVVPCDFMEREDGERAVSALLATKTPVDGLFCANDTIALGALTSLRLHHINSPEDLQVIGFDNTRDSAHATPPLTVIDPFVWQYAQMSVDCLLRRIEGDSSEPGQFTTGFTLVERDTTK